MNINVQRRRLLQGALMGSASQLIPYAWGLSDINVPTWVGYPGGVLQIPVGIIDIEQTETSRQASKPQGWFQKKRIVITPVQGIWMAWIALPLSLSPGEYALNIQNGKRRQEVVFMVQAKSYPEQHLTITNKRQVNPEPVDIERINHEKKIIAEAYKVWNDHDPVIPFSSPFSASAAIAHSSKFGLKRYFNGEPRAPHSGLDFAAPKNMKVMALGKGEVILTGDFFFNGQSVFVHHGQGVVSFYCHLNEILVMQGERINAQQPIGKVGSTGRSTGPHLHLGIYFSGVAVDPEPLIA